MTPAFGWRRTPQLMTRKTRCSMPVPWRRAPTPSSPATSQTSSTRPCRFTPRTTLWGDFCRLLRKMTRLSTIYACAILRAMSLIRARRRWLVALLLLGLPLGLYFALRAQLSWRPQSFSDPHLRIQYVAWSPDGKWLAAAGLGQ